MKKRPPDIGVISRHRCALRRSAHAFAEAKRQQHQGAAVDDAERRVRDAVHAARDAGLGWSDIGAALDLRPGNAYQRYRRP